MRGSPRMAHSRQSVPGEPGTYGPSSTPAPRPDTPQGIRYDDAMIEQLDAMLDSSGNRPL